MKQIKDGMILLMYIPSINDIKGQYPMAKALKMYTVTGSVDKDTNYDYGVYKLDTDLGTSAGWLGMAATIENLTNKQFTITGYPGEHPMQQWTQTGAVKSDDGFKLTYDIDTSAGQSGAPIYENTTYENTTYENTTYDNVYGAYAYGIHTNGGTTNSGTKINQNVFNFALGVRDGTIK